MNTQSEEIKIACPHCGQHLAIDGSMLGTELECPTCKQPFSVSVPMTGNETASEQSTSPVGTADGTVEPAGEIMTASDMTPPTGTSTPPPLPPPLPPSAPEPAPAMSGASRNVALGPAPRAHGPRKRGMTIALLSGVSLLACLFFLFGRGCFQEDIIPDGTLKVAISDSELRAATRESDYQTRSTKYEIPWENQANCVSFDIRFGQGVMKSENGKVDGIWLFELETPSEADKVSVSLRLDNGRIHFTENDGMATESGHHDTPGPTIAVKGDGSPGNWHSIVIRADTDATWFFMDGEKHSLPALGGVKRFEKLSIVDVGSISEIRNMAVYPSKAYQESLKVYREALEAKDPKTSMAKLHQAAESGLCEAQFLLGSFLKTGAMGKRDKKASLRWITKAAEQGDPNSQWALGKSVLWGEDFPEDRKAAHAWLLRGAKSGNAGAQMWLGFQLWRGLGVPKNPSEAEFWLLKAKDGYSLYNKEVGSDVDVGILYFTLAEVYIIGGEGIEKDRDLGIRYLRIAAQYGHSDAKDLLQKIR